MKLLKQTIRNMTVGLNESNKAAVRLEAGYEYRPHNPLTLYIYLGNRQGNSNSVVLLVESAIITEGSIISNEFADMLIVDGSTVRSIRDAVETVRSTFNLEFADFEYHPDFVRMNSALDILHEIHNSESALSSLLEMASN